jgi:hypothetical protein
MEDGLAIELESGETLEIEYTDTPSFYLRPDGTSSYLRPDGTSKYVRP